MNEKTSMGLSSEEAKRRLAQYGPNEVVEENKIHETDEERKEIIDLTEDTVMSEDIHVREPTTEEKLPFFSKTGPCKLEKIARQADKEMGTSVCDNACFTPACFAAAVLCYFGLQMRAVE